VVVADVEHRGDVEPVEHHSALEQPAAGELGDADIDRRIGQQPLQRAPADESPMLHLKLARPGALGGTQRRMAPRLARDVGEHLAGGGLADAAGDPAMGMRALPSGIATRTIGVTTSRAGSEIQCGRSPGEVLISRIQPWPLRHEVPMSGVRKSTPATRAPVICAARSAATRFSGWTRSVTSIAVPPCEMLAARVTLTTWPSPEPRRATGPAQQQCVEPLVDRHPVHQLLVRRAAPRIGVEHFEQGPHRALAVAGYGGRTRLAAATSLPFTTSRR